MAQNRSFKWGDGIFETIRFINNQIQLADLHFERFFLSLRLLGIDTNLTATELTTSIIRLCAKNNCSAAARVRLASFRNDENKAEYLIEAQALSPDTQSWNSQGLTLGIYPYARKSTDAFANLKTANFLTYVLADIHAKQNGWDEALVLNTQNQIADASKANIFLIRKAEIFTPALNQGCINGVMRRFLIEKFKTLGYAVHQQEISEDDLINSEEVFLTNALYGMWWVRAFRKRTYSSMLCSSLYSQIFSPQTKAGPLS